VRVLLDTHIWAWSLLEPERLAPSVKTVLADPGIELWLSPISVWEMTLLIERGRIEIEGSATEWVEEALARVPMKEAALNHAVALRSRRVGLSHDDPADRFLAASASVYKLTLATADDRLIRGEGYRVLANR